MDLPALQQVNSDVIGWIAIPGTEISYPLVQGTDNDYYLTHTWNQTAAQSARFSWTAAALPISAALTPSCTVTG